MFYTINVLPNEKNHRVSIQNTSDSAKEMDLGIFKIGTFRRHIMHIDLPMVNICRSIMSKTNRIIICEHTIQYWTSVYTIRILQNIARRHFRLSRRAWTRVRYD